MFENYRITNGPGALNIYNSSNSRLCVDKAYDSLYLSYENGKDIIIGYGPKTLENQIDYINTDEMKEQFILMCLCALKHLKDHPIIIAKINIIINPFMQKYYK